MSCDQDAGRSGLALRVSRMDLDCGLALVSARNRGPLESSKTGEMLAGYTELGAWNWDTIEEASVERAPGTSMTPLCPCSSADQLPHCLFRPLYLWTSGFGPIILPHMDPWTAIVSVVPGSSFRFPAEIQDRTEKRQTGEATSEIGRPCYCTPEGQRRRKRFQEQDLN